MNLVVFGARTPMLNLDVNQQLLLLVIRLPLVLVSVLNLVTVDYVIKYLDVPGAMIKEDIVLI